MKLKEVALEEVILNLERDYNFLFSYREKDIQNVFVNTPSQAIPVNVFLTSILKGTELQFELVQEHYVLLRKIDLEQSVVEKEDPKILLCGSVIDSLSQLPLAFANIYLRKSKQGTSASEAGAFRFKTEFDIDDTIVISYVGYEEKHLSWNAFRKRTCPEIALSYLDLNQDMVLVTDYLTDGISLTDRANATELRPNSLGVLPGQAEPDVLNTIHFLPGISSTDGAAASISIRGGTPDQNLILWEDIPIYHSAHYFGMISAFNPYIIDKVSVFRGGFDAEYGGRVSGVIDLRSDGRWDAAPKFGLGLNFINGYANGKFSLLNNKASFVFSLRRSIAELWQTPTFENISQKIHQGVLLELPTLNKLPSGINIQDDFKFLDSNIKGNFQLSPKDELTAAWFYANNDFKALIEDDNVKREQFDSLYLEAQGASIAWTHQWKTGFSSKLLALNTDYYYDYKYWVNSVGQNVQDKIGLKNSKIKEQQIQLVNSYQTKAKHKIKLGYQLVHYDVAFQITRAAQANQNDTERNLQSNLHVLYTSFTSSKEKNLGVDFGIRASYFQKNKKTYAAPRLQLWYKLSDAFNFSLTGGKYFQFLSQVLQIQGDQSTIDTPVWVLGGEKEVPVLDATQFQIGGIFQKKSWLVDVQVYYKNIQGLTSLSTGFDDDLGGRYHLGEAKILGMDVLVKKRWKNFRSWISYSLSQSNHHFSSFFDSDFLAPTDQPHAFRWVNMLSVANWEFSLGWKIQSGSPYSLKENYRLELNNSGMGPKETIRPLVNAFNDQRLPAQHQLDASVVYHIVPKNKTNWKAVIGLSIYNLYHQKNLYNRAFFINNEMPKRLRYLNKADLGFTPNVVARFEW